MTYMLPNHVYDLIKFIVTVVMPAVSVLYSRTCWHLGLALRRRGDPHHRGCLHLPLCRDGH